ncbi:hypothetical protein NP233_g4690 [Leucocoprinus birnbaumii]|uniref:Kinase n=1 Tax=Leucocoprinus birnbaumii TaxID=56174 RepID=A0AAD5VU74_9AGAR|nr:hypothetical protein NP233_g4690 [Leucocoprinus birnbaumii]
MSTMDHLNTVTLAAQVGGHAGVLTTEDGELLIKPALRQELAFYQQLQSDETLSVLLPYVPKFIGTLRLEGEVDESKPQEDGIAVKPFVDKADEHFMFWMRFEVLMGYSPNIMDIKLGTVLYDDGASPDKVARMIETAKKTTSLETGVRLTGFQVYDNLTGLAVNTPKSYGKSIKAAQLPEGIAKFFPIGIPPESSPESSSGLPAPLLQKILPGIREEVQEIRDVFAELELRMVGGSLLIVYEGDWKKAQEGVNRLEEDEAEDEEEVDEDEEDAENKPGPPYVVKLIDFAHTKVVPGEGPDKGVLLGMDTVLMLLDGRIKEIAQ